ncbi:hypothetical protein Hypma_005994 [Hypsizygus marmoreus]|uniref:Uncharacterized protein n=1 Tax=Hypsizygus marmoreus TaxID=39966 RepID=A0A369KDJ6_HYPMA|nr:hypothetical protein Hypma_005994 [Hypsizygus marmoreus]
MVAQLHPNLASNFDPDFDQVGNFKFSRFSLNIEWVKNPDWTWSLITHHPTFHIKLFSDLTQDANKEGRNKAVAKDGKLQQYAVLAKHIFELNPAQGISYHTKPARFIMSVERTCTGDFFFSLMRNILIYRKAQN